MVTATETCYVIVRNEGFHHARAPVRPQPCSTYVGASTLPLVPV
jgi:hypothetical protein